MFFQKIKKEYIKTIENLFNDIYDEYDIYDRTTKKLVNKNDLLNKILFRINSESIETKQHKEICNGIYKNGNRCNKNTIENSIYCKKHLNMIQAYNSQELQYKYKNEERLQYKYENQEHENEEYELKIENKNIPVNLETKFIEDSFYYIDENYIYDKSSMEKVGYINKNIGYTNKNVNKNENVDCDKEKYIFTNDPFLLGLF